MTNRRTFIGSAAAAATAVAVSARAASAPSHTRNVTGAVRLKDGTELFVRDWGAGRPVILTHAWPLSSDCWEQQAIALVDAGYRVICYDRRGFGRSSQPSNGYDYDTFAADLHIVLTTLNLVGADLVGFSMGTGEVTRYIGKYGTDRVRKAVLIGTLGPYLLKTPDNPQGVDRQAIEGVKAAVRKDRPAAMLEFLHNFYNFDVLGGKLVSDRVVEENWNVAVGASPLGALKSIDAWTEDFRKDLPRNTVPTLILHGDADRILPADATSRRQVQLLKSCRLIELKGGPHGVLWTHAEEINTELVSFLK
jgi:non-heme chloroperoxidase